MTASWSTQQLAEFLAVVSSAPTEAAAASATVERTAEALDAEVAAIVSGGTVLASVGFPDGAVPVAELAAVAPGIAGALSVSGVGVCAATAVRLEHPPGATLVVGRSGTGLGRQETSLLRGIAHASSITMRMLGLLDAERASREESARDQWRLERLASEQAALHRVAAQVARAAPPEMVFATVTEEIGQVLDVDQAGLTRYDPHGSMTLVASWTSAAVPVDSRWSTGGRDVLTQVFETGRPARVDRHIDATGPGADIDLWSSRSAVAVPIRVEGRLWGVVFVTSTRNDPLPPDTETRLVGFTDLVATAIANAQARVELRSHAADEAALRRVATLVAGGASPEEVFASVTAEIGRLLDVDFTGLSRYDADAAVTVIAHWSGTGSILAPDFRPALGGRNVTTQVFRTGRPARIDNYAGASGPWAGVARVQGLRTAVGAPIAVEGRLWGVVTVSSAREEPLPVDTETRLAAFTELVATAIANAQARVDLRSHAGEEAALRRVATLVAGVAPPEEVFDEVTAEVGRLVAADMTATCRYEADETVAFVGLWNARGESVQIPGPAPIGGANVITQVFRTGRPARLDDYAGASGATADLAGAWGLRSAVGVPITVEGSLWGVIAAATREEPLSADTETRLIAFTELVATAIANAQARQDLRDHAEEQAALRRVATLVARAAPPEEVFAAVAAETGRVLAADVTGLTRFDPDGSVTVVGGWSSSGIPRPAAFGERFSADGPNVIRLVLETGRSARIDDYRDSAGTIADAVRRWGVRSAVGVPISVEGRLWGVMSVAATQRRLPAGTEARLAGFTELVATAIANADSQAQLAASRARIVAAADHARRRIERDLHDGAQQRLVSVVLMLRAVQAAVAPRHPGLEEQLDALAAEATRAIDELRELARGIHPAILAEGGLRPALRALARRCAVPVDLDIRIDGRLPQQIETAAYYVVSEALTNAAKHAHATTVQVEAVAVGGGDDGILRLRVRDDGRGGADTRGGFGLVGLKDRVEALRGTIKIDSPSGRGTDLQVTLPIVDA